MKLALVGYYSPPYGGISVHVKALSDQLRRGNYPFHVYAWQHYGPDTNELTVLKGSTGGRFLQLAKKMKEEIVHVHTHGWGLWTKIFLLKLVRRFRLILSLHNLRFFEELQEARADIRMLSKNLLGQVDRMVIDNPGAYPLLEQLNYPRERILHIPEFIPPMLDEIHFMEFPEKLRTFMKDHTPLLSISVCRMFLNRGLDVYGMDLMVEALKTVIKEHPNLGLVVALSRTDEEQEYQKDIMNRIRQGGLEENVYFFTESVPEIYPLWKKSDIFLRPTASDGNSVSVQEALYFGTPVLASDCTHRPDGCILHKSRNTEDFTRVLLQTLNNLSDEKNKVVRLKIKNNAEDFIRLYESLGLKPSP